MKKHVHHKPENKKTVKTSNHKKVVAKKPVQNTKSGKTKKILLASKKKISKKTKVVVKKPQGATKKIVSKTHAPSTNNSNTGGQIKIKIAAAKKVNRKKSGVMGGIVDTQTIGVNILNEIIKSMFQNDVVKHVNHKNRVIRASIIDSRFEKYHLSEDIPEKIIWVFKNAAIVITHDIEGVKSDEDFIEYLKINHVGGSQPTRGERTNDVLQQIFSSSISNSVILSKEDELKYVKYVRSKDPEIATIGRHKLITSNLRLVITWARKYSKRGIEFEDLIQEGTTGLNKAIDKFDYKQNIKFATYATWWIRQAITKIVTDQNKIIRIPVHMSDFINTFNKKEQELINELGRNPTISELTESMPNVGNDVAKKISDLKKIIANPVSLEKPISSDEESHFTDFVKDDTTESIEERIETDERNKELHRVLANKLTPEEDKIICMRTGMKEYPQAMSLDDIAKVLKMKKEKIRQIENKAIKKLKQGLQGSLSLFFDVDK